VKRSETISRTVRKLREDGKIVQANVTDAEVEDAYQRNKSTLPKREASVAWRQIIIAPRPSPAAKERGARQGPNRCSSSSRPQRLREARQARVDGSGLQGQRRGDLGGIAAAAWSRSSIAGCSRSRLDSSGPVMRRRSLSHHSRGSRAAG